MIEQNLPSSRRRDRRSVPEPQLMKRDVIVHELRARILSGDLPRGSRMRQDELARKFDASITPVREALRLLEAEGLLESEPHRGVRVAAVDLEKVKAIYVVRRLTEAYAMRRAVSRLSPRDIAQAHTLLDRMEQLRLAGNLEGFRRDNKAFHFLFYDRSGLPALSDQIEAMWQSFPWDLMLTTEERTAQSHSEHLAILAAVEAQDADAAARECETHIMHTYQSIAQNLAGNDEAVADPFDLNTD
ncbi:GntR family transcriptional regulator [Microbacterium sp. 22303]|uniref:GntR family transcriptional regulator n=1 Tax=Microbacterium sp. 22303 TaxID=3453905 RepID=UPI003F84F3FF